MVRWRVVESRNFMPFGVGLHPVSVVDESAQITPARRETQ